MSKKDFKNTKDYSYIKRKHTNILDLLENPRYGTVDELGNQVEIKKEALGISTKYNVILIKDVIPLFEEMMEYFENLNKKQLIDSSGTFLNNLKPVNLYVNPDKIEYDSVRLTVDQLKLYCIKYGLQWQNFEEFCDIFFDILRVGVRGGARPYARSMPAATLRGGSARSVLEWGLAVGLCSTQDSVCNRANIYGDKYFDTFASVSKYFGFMINYYEPKQLIFNLKSEALSITVDRIFESWYNRSIGSFPEKIFYRLVTMYDLLNEELPFYQIKKFDGCKTKIKQLTKSESPSIEQVNIMYLYFDYMTSINKINISPTDRKRYLNTLDSLNQLEAIEYVNSFLKTVKAG